MQRTLYHLSEETFRQLGNEIIGRRRNHNLFPADVTEKRCFHAFFGTSPFICALLWAMIEPSKTLPRGHHPKHLLWALMFMKIYATEPVHRRLAGNPDEKTFRKWTWLLIHAIEGLDQSVVSIYLLLSSLCIVFSFLLCQLTNALFFFASGPGRQQTDRLEQLQAWSWRA